MVKGKFLEYGDDLSEVNRIYQEENVPAAIEYDDTGIVAVHVLVNDGDKNVAAGTISMRDNKFYIDQVVVLKDERNKYYGDFIVRMLIDKAFQTGAFQVYVFAQKESINFFKKIGFENELDELNYEVNSNRSLMSISKNDVCKKCCH